MDHSNKLNEYYVSFEKNNQIIIGKNKELNHKQMIIDGKAKLDINKFEYLFGISCIRCDCDNCDGFEFKIWFD